jgi:hypothetical protein
MSAPVNTSSNANNQYDVSQVYTAVKVDLRAAIDASAGVTVFGPSEETLYNVIWCDLPLDVLGLYSDPSNALIEFWEPSTAGQRGTISARIAKDDIGGTNRNARAVAQLFAESMANVIKGGMDASAANPFQSYSGPAYTKYTSFGELALSYAAEGMFGHPSATAAITNDTALVTGFNNDAKKLTPVTELVLATNSDQALAQRLATALYGSSDAVATAIAQSVLGQDAVRMTNDDNSALQVDRKAALRFIAGDVVYVAITLKNFVPTIGGNSPALQQLTIGEINTPREEKYYLRIRLTTGGQ